MRNDSSQKANMSPVFPHNAPLTPMAQKPPNNVSACGSSCRTETQKNEKMYRQSNMYNLKQAAPTVHGVQGAHAAAAASVMARGRESQQKCRCFPFPGSALSEGRSVVGQS